MFLLNSFKLTTNSQELEIMQRTYRLQIFKELMILILALWVEYLKRTVWAFKSAKSLVEKVLMNSYILCKFLIFLIPRRRKRNHLFHRVKISWDD